MDQFFCRELPPLTYEFVFLNSMSIMSTNSHKDKEKRVRGRKQLWGQEAKCRVFRPPVSLSCACHHMRTILEWFLGKPLPRELHYEKKVLQKNKYGCLLTAQPSKLHSCFDIFLREETINRIPSSILNLWPHVAGSIFLKKFFFKKIPLQPSWVRTVLF